MTYGTPATDNTQTKPVTIHTLNTLKQQGERFAVVALYDAVMSAIAERNGVEVVLVGDSLGMTVQGHNSTLPVTMDDMLYHVANVARGARHALVLADLPFMSYATLEDALHNCARIMQAGAHMVKLEGGAWLEETVRQLSERGIPVCAHLGLTPQSVNKFGGFRVQGRNDAEASAILQAAITLAEAGADILLLECVPAPLAGEITRRVKVPVVGIGAGRETDAQVLVINDILGLTERAPKFSKNFLQQSGNVSAAIAQYAADVKSGVFPSDENIFL